jgi:Na+-translocating ferredoxin:NAD+ oxidoreductase RnfC subunit
VNNENVTTKFITIAGLVNKPITVEVPIGVTVKSLIAMAGGFSTDDNVMIMGGPMTGKLCSIYDIVTKTTKAILVLPPTCPPITKRQSTTKHNLKIAMSVCSQCSMCTNLCPRNLLGASIKPNEFMRAIASGVTYNVEPFLDTFYCVSCGLCEMYSCYQGLSPRRLIDDYKSGLRAKGVKPPDKPNKPVNRLREELKVPEHRLINRLGLAKFDIPAPMASSEVEVNEVKLLFSQSIGAPCITTVKVGDQVTKGQIVGQPPEGALGVCLHASIDGKVAAVTDNFITISKK